MDIAVFGVGYVGAVSAACLANDGHNVVAVDPNPEKVEPLSRGEAPVLEPGLNEIVSQAVTRGRLRSTADGRSAVHETDLSLVCVGTPSRRNGSLDTSNVAAVSRSLGEILREKNDFHSVVVRSTILPGTMDGMVIPTLEQASGKSAGEDFGIGYFPEFLREGTALKDYNEPGTIVFGGADNRTIEALYNINSRFAVKPFVVDIATAEAIKYTNNAWHALKISFANEVGNICQSCGIDGHAVMDVLCSDRRLNISTAYLRPGFAFGGSCLPKDLRAFSYAAKMRDVPTPILNATLEANSLQVDRAFEMIVATGARRVGLLGLSFKPDTDDLRESPMVDLAERLVGKGFELRIYDPNVQMGKLTGANSSYIRSRIPHLSTLLSQDIMEVVDHAETVVVYNPFAAAEVRGALESKSVVDLVRFDAAKRSSGQYHGICW